MLLEIALLTSAIEIITCIGRFWLKQRARNWNWPVRIHHGYVGIALLLLWFALPKDMLLVGGASLVLSDAIHHFVVLPLAVGSTEFP